MFSEVSDCKIEFTKNFFLRLGELLNMMMDGFVSLNRA
jgi:hypothetical protein